MQIYCTRHYIFQLLPKVNKMRFKGNVFAFLVNKGYYLKLMAVIDIYTLLTMCRLYSTIVFLLTVIGGVYACPPLFFDKNCSTCPSYAQYICDYENKMAYLHVDYRVYNHSDNNGSHTWLMGHNAFELPCHREDLKKYVIYEKIKANANKQMCHHIHRDYTNPLEFCGRCKSGYGPSPYTYYGVPCTKCSFRVPGWFLYILLELGFPTLMFISFLLLRIRITSGAMIGFAFYCQMIFNTFTMPYFYYVLATQSPWITNTILTLYGFWNMDFFRLVVPKFCVSTHINTLDVIALGYVSAFYPLSLTVVVYILMKLHQRGCKLLVLAWKPFHRYTVMFKRRILSDKISLTDTFATFVLLSYSKILFVSMQILRPYNFYTLARNGTFLGHYSVSRRTVDPMIHYLSGHHMLYAIPALLIMLTFSILPAVVLCLYPYQCSHKLLKKCRLTASKDFVKFINVFQDSFKNGENGTHNYRAVSALYVIHRVLVFSSYIVLQSHDFLNSDPFVYQAILYIATFAFYSYAEPYKKNVHNYMELLLLALLTAQSLLTFELYGACQFGNVASENCTKKLSNLVTTQLCVLLIPQLAITAYVLCLFSKRAGLRFSKHIETYATGESISEFPNYKSLENTFLLSS